MVIIKKFSSDIIRHMTLFEGVTRVRPIDYYSVNSTIFFFVEKGMAGLAVGKQGSNIQVLSKNLERDVRIIEKANDYSELVVNYLFPIKPVKIYIENSAINIKFAKPMQRRRLLSNKQVELRLLFSLVQNYYPDIKDIKVL